MSSESEQPTLPYPEVGGQEFTSGWSGSDTSHERAQSEDRSGVTAKRQRETYAYIYVTGVSGMTVKDLRDITGWHHGQASSVLSTLHKAGFIERLTERRDRCQVYVHPEYVRDRTTVPHKRNRSKQTYSLAEVRDGTGWPEGVRFAVVEEN